MEIRGPIRSIFYPHKAIRSELSVLSDLAEKLELNAHVSEIEERVDFLEDAVSAHAKGEEAAFYPAADELRRDISKSFSWDHEFDAQLFQTIKASIARVKGGGNQADLESLKRNIHALNGTLTAHSQKEEDLLVPLIDQEVDLVKQGEMLAKIVAEIPPDLMERVLKWMVVIISPEERTDYLEIVKTGAPPEAFGVMADWVRQVLSEDEWKELAGRVPDLE